MTFNYRCSQLHPRITTCQYLHPHQSLFHDRVGGGGDGRTGPIQRPGDVKE